jgi:anhydro-N-acetylmuramic acid kinase
MLSIGLMSGTSMDGIDAALIETCGNTTITDLAHFSVSYTNEMKTLLKIAEFATRQSAGNLSATHNYFPEAIYHYLTTEHNLTTETIPTAIAALNYYIHANTNIAVTFSDVIQHSTILHADVVQQLLKNSNYLATQINVIGYHGQTLFHHPAKKITVQIGDGKLLTKLTGITTVNDFRSHDVAMGGQGAPFAPLYHHALAIRDKKYPVAIVNCGGIANVTLITDEQPTHILGFDTGPGNGLIDRYVKKSMQGREHMDENGKYGSQGMVDNTLLKLLYEKAVHINNQNFFAQQPPKSLDIGNLHLIEELQYLSIQDACRTLEAFTADSIVKSIDFFNAVPTQWILCGGGWHNPIIKHEFMTRLKNRIGNNADIQTADEAGWNSQAMEAQIFAYLAVRCLLKLPISMPGTTRVPTPLTGGVIHYSS